LNVPGRVLHLRRSDQGQDVVEYALLAAFVCLASAAIFMMSDQSMVGIWGLANSALTNANKVAMNAAGS
jgi:Flp pilus assembly pilin Flp